MSAIPILTAFLLAASPHTPNLRATEVQSGFSDDLSEKFAEALRHALPKAKHMRLGNGDDADDLVLSLLFKVDDRGDRFTYAVDLLKANPPLTPDRLASFTGSCKDSAIDACALKLIRDADGKVKD